MSRPSWDDEMREAALTTLDSLRWVKGPHAIAFANEFADYCGALGAVTCSSGSTALWAALRVLEIGPGDEVILPTLTFIATATAVSNTGAIPIFVDIEPDYWCIDPEEVRKAINENTKAVIGVHLFGQMFSSKLIEICKEAKIPLIEDAAQAHGGELDGKKAGSLAEIACFSFFPSKNIAVGGEGGMITTNDPSLLHTLQQIIDNGRAEDLLSHEIGSNLRMPEVAASIGRVQLSRLEKWITKRTSIAEQYPSIPIREHSQHAFHQYNILSDNPQELIAELNSDGITARIHYPTPCHQHPVYQNHSQYNDEFPITDSVCSRLVSVPIFHEMSDEEITRVSSCLEKTASSPGLHSTTL